MKKVYVIPNIITAFGLACGLFVIFKANLTTGTSTYQILYSSALLLLLAALADLLDGAVARVMRAESEFGVIFDSLADAVSFGVTPSVLLLKSLTLEEGSILSFCALIGAMGYSLCGVLRLVRYNVKAKNAVGNPQEIEAQKKHFTGLPIPAAAAAAVSLNLFFSSSFASHIPELWRSILLIIAMVILGYFMVSRWKFPSLKALDFRVASVQLIFFTVIFALITLYGLLYFFSIAFLCAAWGYVFIGWVLSIIRLIAGKKSKTLEDFEPEPEDYE